MERPERRAMGHSEKMNGTRLGKGRSASMKGHWGMVRGKKRALPTNNSLGLKRKSPERNLSWRKREGGGALDCPGRRRKKNCLIDDF